MNRPALYMAVLALLPALAAGTLARDMRAMAPGQALAEGARREMAMAAEEAARVAEQAAQGREELLSRIRELEAENQALKQETESLEHRRDALKARASALSRRLSGLDERTRDLAAAARSAAREAAALVSQSPYTALKPGRGDFLDRLGADGSFPGMADLSALADLLFAEIELSGQVQVVEQAIVARSGREVPATVLLAGPHTAAFSTKDETGFLLYSPASKRLFALSRTPPGDIARALKKYMEGRTDGLPMDVSSGAAVRRIARRPDLAAQVAGGGPLVWPILLVGLFGLAIVLERAATFYAARVDADALMAKLSGPCKRGDWQACQKALDAAGDKPVPRVLSAGLAHAGSGRQEMENALQEAILGEIPRMERFLSTLGMLAAIAPLLGLLGTVTGMINTFHAITYFGTGDPKMMSGGISEALVTTMLGLCVAVPLLLFHTVLSRQAESGIGTMEEKAVSLVNMVSSRENAA
ncbi:MAG: MotA/TolQ/ExbB proton channel family protein [Deltaproteobacteria bacterium]|nr:MotA/TolQ/ExbB proton channel family protein [Deltaproteobacteria bacterium]